MESYIHLYKTNSEFTASYNGPDYKEPWLSLTEENMEVSYNKPKLTAITFNSITWVTDIPAKGGTATKDNCTFEVYAKYNNGISVDISSDATVTGELVVPSSKATTRHEVGQLTLTASYSGLTATGNVTAYQEAVPDPSMEPLTFNILSAGTINWTASNTAITKTIDYKLNDGEWASITSNTGSSAPTITVNPGDKIQFKGNNKQYTNSSSRYNSFSGSTALFEIEGNIMSLIYGDDFKNKLTISSDCTFVGLFRGCNNLISAGNLILPATTLANYCYSYMFYNCASLTTAPELPATTLADYCYYQMFQNCTSLTTAPKLPATTLASYCYQNMFYGCTSLTTAPELPATTLANYCYYGMFYGTNVLPDCSNIDFASSTVVASGGLKGLFSGTKVTDNDLERLLPKNDNGKYYLPATTLADYCYYQMFQNCTSLTTAPALPATTLANYCYDSMFRNCTSLTTAPALPATTLKPYCYEYMFSNCKSLTTVPELPATTLANGCYGYMFQDCTSLTTAPELPATTLANYCYECMFQNCRRLTTAPALPATTLASNCYYYMFQNCTSLTTAPELPATTLANGCYRSMFYGCTKLNYIKCLATDISATDCTKNWVSGVASTGTFVKASSMTSWTTGVNGIPANWTVEDNQEPLTFNIVSAGTINWTASDASIAKTIDYKLNDNEWISITSNTGSSAPTITVNPGDKLQFKGNNEQYTNSSSRYNSFSGSTALFEAEGNIMSLIYGDDFKNNLTISSDYAFVGLFRNCTKLVSVENLVLPATTLANYCYSYMFQNCTSLTTAPTLPATTLASYCYQNMFYGCTSLTTAPTLPATTLASYCYQNMFYGCTSLTTAPELPATTLASNCYYYMFQNCTSLTTVPELPATTLADYCYSDMFYGCTSLTAAPELPATTLADYCYYHMFQNCTSLTTVPELPATTLATQCYYGMFQNCTSLTTAPALPATTLANGCYRSMFYGCTNLNYIKCLATDISASNCTNAWVEGVASTGTFVKKQGITWAEGTSGIPTGWTVQDA